MIVSLFYLLMMISLLIPRSRSFSSRRVLKTPFKSNSNVHMLGTTKEDPPLEAAYKQCQLLTKQNSKTFYLGTTLMKKDIRKHLWAIYSWCRRTDNIVDNFTSLQSSEILSNELALWENRLENIFKEKKHEDLYDLALVDTIQKFPSSSVEPYRDMINGMIMDVPGIGQNRYKSFDELYLYCYRAAGTVGLMTLPVLGTSKGFSVNDAKESAVALGIAFQLTNILRDVGEDLKLYNRIYLPTDELKSFHVEEEDLRNGIITPQYKDLIQFQIDRANSYYKIAKEGIHFLDPSVQFPILTSLELYRKILEIIQVQNRYNNLDYRASTTKWSKLSILIQSYFRSFFLPSSKHKSL
jgi:phytoene synthase